MDGVYDEGVRVKGRQQDKEDVNMDVLVDSGLGTGGQS